jgi:DNA-binding response OmpR family regulator
MKILIAEDESEIWIPYRVELEARGHDVVITEDGISCLEEYKKGLANKPFEVVVLDYRMPQLDGMEVAKEILKLNRKQRIIFASAYVKETLEDSVKQLKQPVELIQKPFEADVLADTIEDQEAYFGLKSLIKNIRGFNLEQPSSENIRDLFEGLRRIQKGRTF